MSARTSPSVMACVKRNAHAHWIGWSLLVLGVALSIASGWSIVTGLNRPPGRDLGRLAALTAIWAVVAGISIARRAR